MNVLHTYLPGGSGEGAAGSPELSAGIQRRHHDAASRPSPLDKPVRRDVWEYRSRMLFVCSQRVQVFRQNRSLYSHKVKDVRVGIRLCYYVGGVVALHSCIILTAAVHPLGCTPTYRRKLIAAADGKKIYCVFPSRGLLH